MQSCLKRTAAMSSGPQLFRLKKKNTLMCMYIYTVSFKDSVCLEKELLNKNSSPVILEKAGICINQFRLPSLLKLQHLKHDLWS